MKRQRGFTLIEIAIVLVIIGLLLGGVLKGQELITTARVRNLISQQDSVKAAYFGFLDRYRALPGDYSAAKTNINGISDGCETDKGKGNGDGNGQISAGAESVLVWEHLSKSGFITGSYNCAAVEGTETTIQNPFGSRMQLISDNVFAESGGSIRNNLKTGAQISSDMLADMDRKIDDGAANSGSFRFSVYASGGAAPKGDEAGGCYVKGAWHSANPVGNCGGASLF